MVSAGAVVLTLSFPGSRGLAAPPRDSEPETRSWDRKLDPFLRHIALGSEKHQGPIEEKLPARSREVMHALPPFVRAERDADDPIVYVKARLQSMRDEVATAPRSAAAPGEGRARLPEALARRLQALGVTVRGRAGDIVSLAVPASALEEVARLDDIRSLRAGRAYRLQNDVSTSDAFTASRTENTTFANAGQNVIVAVIDTGIDWTNPDFRNADGTTRILGIWDQIITDAAHPPPSGFGFGAYYTKADIDAALLGGPTLATQDGYGHGTHVAGSAAGNGRQTGNGVPAGTFAGVAPAADLLAVRVFDDNAVFCDQCDLVSAVDFIDGFAQTAGKPWVGNMSLGDDTGGAHDGTSSDELAIDALVRPGRPGTQLAVAAGNSGRSDRHFHWDGTLGAAGTSVTNTFSLASVPARSGSENDFFWLDFWYRGSDSATFQIVTPGAQTVSAARGIDGGIVCTPSGAVHIDAGNANDPDNGDNEVFVQIWDASACGGVEPAIGSWTIRVVTDALGGATGGPFDLWNAADANRASTGFVNLSVFSLAKSVSVPGTARNAITAGAFNSKVSWINGAGTTTTIPGTVGERASFSGIGPTRDGRIKPDVAAPGNSVGSSKSVKINPASTNRERDNIHWDASGTSMATPHVAGAAALLLSLHPGFDGAQVKSAIQRSARVDLQTGSAPNNLFGWGKLRALEAAFEAGAASGQIAAAASGSQFSWAADPQMSSWNVYRGTIPGISATNYGTCFLRGLTMPQFNDASVPPANQAWFYHVAGVYLNPTTSQFVEGSLGTDSHGVERPNNFPCP
jgi:subtilisin family serine protease